MEEFDVFGVRLKGQFPLGLLLLLSLDLALLHVPGDELGRQVVALCELIILFL